MVSPALRLRGRITPLSLLAIGLLVSLILMSAATQNSALFGHLYSLLLVVNLLGAVVLLVLIALNIYKLVVQYRARVMGSRLTLRLVWTLGLLTVIPVLVVFIFSVQALNRGIDSWFDVKIEQAMDDALNLGRTSLGALKQEMARRSEEMAEELETTSDKLALTALNYLREKHNAYELTLFTQDGRIIASSSREGPDASSLIPDRPDEKILTQIRRGLSYANVDPVGNGELLLRVVVPVYKHDVSAPVRILQILQQLPNRYAKLGESVQSSFAEYEKLIYLRGPLKFGFTLTLSLVALLTLLLAISGAIVAARRLAAPLRDLAAGTEAVARGDYRTQLPVPSQDEFGILVNSFNDMTRQIRRAQNQTRRSQFEAETQRNYLEAVLAHLSSGVLTFDNKGRLRTRNTVAEQILQQFLTDAIRQELTWMQHQYPRLAPFLDTVAYAIAQDLPEWQEEVIFDSDSGRRVLIVRGTRLPGAGERGGGHIIVFDDATALIQAQRDAAWGEVARRLAHEIKNPLTPIQLSAERIRHKCMDQLNADTRLMLERATGTIIDQVESLKSMVNAFSSYARPAQIQKAPVDLNALVRDVTTLYEHTEGERAPMRVQLDLDPGLPAVSADSGRLRQVLHNLFLNAQDALAQHTTAPLLRIRTECTGPDDCHMVHIVIEDNGPGFPEDLVDRLFEPYVTTKEKGTGLGLAIVKKIVEEHNGSLRADNPKDGGARLLIRLPVDQARSIKDEATRA